MHRVTQKTRLKAELKANGRWPAFVKRREDLKAGGMEPSAAWAKAAEEFSSAESAAEDVKLKAEGGDEGAMTPDEAVAQEPGTEAAESESRREETEDRVREVTAEFWDGRRQAGVRESFDWVVKHAWKEWVRPEECPGAFAWSWWRLIRGDEKKIERFMFDVGAKMMPNRSEMEVEERRRRGSGDLLDLIGKLRAEIEESELPVGAEGRPAGSGPDT